MAAYKSSIPGTAREKVTERFPSGRKRKAEYRVGGKVVGIRYFFQSGEPEHECGLKEGKKHGVEYWWLGGNLPRSAEPFVDGLPHGLAKQWDQDGRLLGTYRMVRGTGIDLWRQRREDGSICLSEVLHLNGGHRHGFEWWLNEDQRTVYIERHWRESMWHGIYREWNEAGRLRRGFPQYFVSGAQVTKRQYLKACASDPTLPPFRQQDNSPSRAFPPKVVKHLRP